MNSIKHTSKSEVIKNRKLYEYFFNGKLKTLKVKINKQTVGSATGEKAARIWNKLINE